MTTTTQLREVLDDQGKPIVQGSPAWWEAKKGIPTASDFGSIVQPPQQMIVKCRKKADSLYAQGSIDGMSLSDEAMEKLHDFAMHGGTGIAIAITKRSGSWEKYQDILLAERMWSLAEYRHKLENSFAGTPATEDGLRREPELRRWVAMQEGQEIRETGFILSECGRYGVSPDGLFPDNRPLEMKNPDLPTFFGYTRSSVEVRKHFPQVHGAILVTGAPEGILAFGADHEEVDHFLKRIPRSHYTKNLEEALDIFCRELDELEEMHRN